MTGPQHLWSGNWEEESSSSEPPATTTTRPTPAPTPVRRRRPRRPAWIALSVIVLVAGAAAVVFTSVGGPSRHRTAEVATTPPAPSLTATPPATTTPPSPASPLVRWLGMELVSVPPGGATVDTVRLGSVADRAGLSPGDVILAIDNRNVSGAGTIAKAISGLHAGDKVQLQVSHGSELFQTTVTLGASPTRYP